MKVVFLPEAEADIERLYGFVRQHSPSLAEKAMRTIDAGVELLTNNPRAGTIMNDRPQYRQLFKPFGNSAYVLRYRIDDSSDTLIVVRIWHGREDRR